MERIEAEGQIAYNAPVGTVVDKIWHEIGKDSYNGNRKKPMSRETVRTVPLPEVELE